MRKRTQEEHVDVEKWAIPYADLLTLLLAFFVVMYSLSSVNEGKFRVLAESMRQAFHGTGQVIGETKVLHPHQEKLPNEAHAYGAMPISRIPVPVPPRDEPPPGHEGAASKPSPGSDVQVASLKSIASKVTQALKPWVDSNKVVIRETKQWVEIEIRTDVLFPSGVAQLAEPAHSVLDNVAAVLAQFPNPIRVEGYTDNRPIKTSRFPSNWELSAARAGSVARLFREHGVDPARMGIFGWGDTHPVASNATPEGRNRNRRIAIVVLGDHGMPRRYYSNSDGQSVAASPTPAEPSPVAHGTAAQAAAGKPGAASDVASAVGAGLHGLH
ncbi:MAG TPA: flagellar motor protein MotD [Rhodanobacteraceae bacterium]|nr:flagellar motor protein MotD [Rhodanobacteraceae bacterium]